MTSKRERRLLCHYRLPRDLHRALKVRAARRGVTMTSLVERALCALLGRRYPEKEG